MSDLTPKPSYTIVKAVKTSSVCPSQWDAWTDSGQYLYLRYRWGCGTVEEQPSPDVSEWATKEPEVLFGTGDPYDGDISLTEFAARAGLTLKLGGAR